MSQEKLTYKARSVDYWNFVTYHMAIDSGGKSHEEIEAIRQREHREYYEGWFVWWEARAEHPSRLWETYEHPGKISNFGRYDILRDEVQKVKYYIDEGIKFIPVLDEFVPEFYYWIYSYRDNQEEELE